MFDWRLWIGHVFGRDVPHVAKLHSSALDSEIQVSLFKKVPFSPYLKKHENINKQMVCSTYQYGNFIFKKSFPNISKA